MGIIIGYIIGGENLTGTSSETISISVPKDMKVWLETEGKHINRSELFREAVLQRQKPTRVSSVVFLISIMGIVFSIALIGIGVTPSPIHYITRAFLALLGGILALMTSIVYYKERLKIKEV